MSPLHPRLAYEDFMKIAPTANAALLAVGRTVEESGLDKTLIELIKLRVSQINGCAFCIQFHLNKIRALNVPQEKLDLVAVWNDVDLFSDREAAALSWAETLTEISGQGVPDEAYAAVRKYFSEVEVAFLSVAIGIVNNWNRIGIAFGFPPPTLH